MSLELPDGAGSIQFVVSSRQLASRESIDDGSAWSACSGDTERTDQGAPRPPRRSGGGCVVVGARVVVVVCGSGSVWWWLVMAGQGPEARKCSYSHRSPLTSHLSPLHRSPPPRTTFLPPRPASTGAHDSHSLDSLASSSASACAAAVSGTVSSLSPGTGAGTAGPSCSNSNYEVEQKWQVSGLGVMSGGCGSAVCRRFSPCVWEGR